MATHESLLKYLDSKVKPKTTWEEFGEIVVQSEIDVPGDICEHCKGSLVEVREELLKMVNDPSRPKDLSPWHFVQYLLGQWHSRTLIEVLLSLIRRLFMFDGN
jgi:hypothetical protein